MFEFAHPWFLLLIVLPLLVYRFLAPSAQQESAFPVPFLTHIPQTPTPTMGFKSFWLRFVIWCFCVLAFAGPRTLGPTLRSPEKGRNIMMVMDVSGSMAMADMPWQGYFVPRIDAVKQAAKRFVQERPLDNIGLVLFGARAYLQTPLTFDHDNVNQRIDEALPGLAGQSTSIGDALGLALKHLDKVPAAGRVVILLTDGVNNSGLLVPEKAADIARDRGVRVYTIGIGGAQNSHFDAETVDTALLQRIASKTGGRAFQANDGQQLMQTYHEIDALEQVVHRAKPIQLMHELYCWPLAVALILFTLWLFFQRNLVVLPRSFARSSKRCSG